MIVSRRKQQVLDYIKDFIVQEGMPPTRAEIAKHFAFNSINSAVEHLQALHNAGLIVLVPRRSRGIRVVPQKAVAE